MESFEGNLLLSTLEHVHAAFQVLNVRNVAVHDGEIVTLQQQFAQELKI